MTLQSLPQTQQSRCRPPGTWTLRAGRALTLRPAQAGVLRVAGGRLWATYDGPHGHRPDDSGDQVVGRGAVLPMRAGQRLVVEPWGGPSACFTWEPTPVQPLARVQRTAVMQPLADVRLALVFGAGAFARLLVALVGLAVVRARPRRPAAKPCAPG